MDNLKLFCLRYGKGGRMVCDRKNAILFYNNKMVAKSYRLDGIVVSYGPDHKKYKYIKGDM